MNFQRAMSTGVVRSAICSLLVDQDCLESIQHFKEIKEEVRQFVQAITKDDSHLNQFDSFATKLMKLLEKCFFSCISEDVQCRSKYVQRERVWSAFHQLRIAEGSKLWRDLFSHHGFPKLSPVVYQQVNQKLYSDLINCHLSAKLDDSADGSAVEIPALTSDEENILRYVAGYVPFKLLKRYEKDLSLESTVGIIECLSAMAVNGEESSLLEYTRKWTHLVNRGGLFEVNDTTYTLFREIEKKIRKKLLVAFDRKTSDNDLRESLINSIASDDNIQFYWTILSVDIESEILATEVLKQIIGTWLTVRGFSIAGMWLDKYLHISNKSSSKKKGLRTELKRTGTTKSPESEH